MPNKDFLESYPLYKKFYLDNHIPYTLVDIPTPAIKMYCNICESNQTFNKKVPYFKSHEEIRNFRSNGEVIGFEYMCRGCGEFSRYFFLEISEDLDWVRKVGQLPPWDISVDKEIRALLGKEHTDIYQKGLINESQGYGIGAFAYYRRIVEDVIDELLDDMYVMIDENNKKEYKEALDQIITSHNAEDKIKAVQDLLPQSLTPEGNNPLKLLYSTLSEGIHSNSDDECLENAEIVRHILTFLITEVRKHKRDSKQFTDSIKTLVKNKKKNK